jgi:hypothetical protein
VSSEREPLVLGRAKEGDLSQAEVAGMVGEPAKRLARRVMRRPLEKAGKVGLAAAAASAAALALLLCAASLRVPAAVDFALAAPRKLWSGGVSIAAEAPPSERARVLPGGRAPAAAPPVVAAGEEECDLFDGKWVWDDSYPLYQSRDCPFLDPGFRCSENGRPDLSYAKWRWQPSRCDLTRLVCPSSSY